MHFTCSYNLEQVNLSLKLYNPPPHKIYPPKTLTIIISMNLIILLDCWQKIESFTFLKFENPSSGSEVRVGGVFQPPLPPFDIYNDILFLNLNHPPLIKYTRLKP